MNTWMKVIPQDGVILNKYGRPYKKRNRQGYVQIESTGHIHVGMAHRIIWEFVNGPIPDGMQINHINGIKHDNRIDNLEVVTQSENTKHAYRIGLASAKGEKNGRHIGKLRKIMEAA